FAMDKSKNIKKTKASGMDKHLTRRRIMDCVSGKRDYAAEELKHLTSCSTCQAVQTVIMKSRAAAENQNEERRSRRPNRRKRQYRFDRSGPFLRLCERHNGMCQSFGNDLPQIDVAVIYDFGVSRQGTNRGNRAGIG